MQLPCARYVASMSGLPAGIVRNLAIDNDGHVLSCFQKLHDLGALASEICPSGFGVGILLDAAVGLAIQGENDLDKTLAGRFANRKRFSVNFDGTRAVHQSRPPHLDQHLIERTRRRGHEKHDNASGEPKKEADQRAWRSASIQETRRSLLEVSKSKNSMPMPTRGFTIRTTTKASSTSPLQVSFMRARAFIERGLLVQTKQPPKEMSEVIPLTCLPVSRSMSSTSAANG